MIKHKFELLVLSLPLLLVVIAFATRSALIAQFLGMTAGVSLVPESIAAGILIGVTRNAYAQSLLSSIWALIWHYKLYIEFKDNIIPMDFSFFIIITTAYGLLFWSCCSSILLKIVLKKFK